MLINEKSLNHWLESFYGFGSWDAPVWFVGYEEGGGDLPEEVAEKLNYFDKKHPDCIPSLINLREMYRHTAFRADGPGAEQFASLYDYRFGHDAKLHGVWKNLIAFAHGYQGKKLPDLLTYQKKSFAISSEAIIQLYPLPSPHNHAWYYSWLDLPQKSFLKTRKTYEEHLYPERIHTLFEKIAVHAPSVVVMYGMNNIISLKESVKNFFPGAKFKMVKGIRLVTPQYHRTDFNGTTLLITTQTPALKHNRVETGFNWEQFGRNLK